MQCITLKCTYRKAENPRGSHDLVKSDFIVDLELNNKGTVASWAVDDRTACFYTDLTKFDENEIVFEGSEIDGQTGSLVINRMSKQFIQKSDVGGEWLKLTGTFEFLSS